MLWFDAHLDLACLALNGRDMFAPVDALTEQTRGPWPPPSVTLPSLAAGNVHFALVTVFTEAGGSGPEGYPHGDAERAASCGRAQLAVYDDWRSRGSIKVDLVQALAEAAPASASPLHVGILVECADPIRSPEELPWWIDRGVVAIGLTWARSSRYAAGNSIAPADDFGLTPLGREMVSEMDRVGVVHDLSHLSDRATDEILSLARGPVIASHSNCRALLNDPANQRHLRDETIREIGRRGGVIGLNLCRNFIAPAPYAKTDARPTVAQAIDHVEHIAGLMGHRRGVGLGSDLDGGFSAHDLPEGIERPAQLTRLTKELSDRGWPIDDIRAFAHENWRRVFSRRESRR